MFFLSFSLISSAQNETCTPEDEFVQGREWCATAFGINKTYGNSGTSYVRNCCDSFVIEFEFRLNTDDIYAPNPVYAGLFSDYLDLNDPDLIFENCQVVYNATEDRDEVIVDMTFPSANELQNSRAYARVIDPTPSGFPGFDANSYKFFCKDNSGTRDYINALYVSGVVPNTCLKTSLVSDLYDEEVFTSTYQTGFGLESYETLIVDEDLQLGSGFPNIESKIIVVGAGSQIVVKSGIKLEVYDRDFRNCTGKLWKGIYVEEGAELVIKDSEIPYAEHAVEFEKGAILTMENNVFVDNYISMKGIPNNVGGSNTEITSFKNNVFKGTGTLYDKYDGQSTNPQDYPFAGIVLGGSTTGWKTCGTIRLTTANVADRNEFSKMANGIINTDNGAHLYIKGCVFEDINSTYGDGYITKGFGILHENPVHSCIINGFNSWPNNYSFNNVGTAFRSNLASIVKFKNQEVTLSERGVHSTKTILSSYINDNKFSTSWNAIELANSYILADFEIVDNTIDMDISTPVVEKKGGIVLSNLICPGNEYYSTSIMKGNSINARYAQTGIGMFDVENLIAQENTVDLAPDIEDVLGIEVLGGQNLNITCNGIVGHYDEAGVNDVSTGIYFSEVTNTEFTCNELDSTNVGIHAYAMNEDTDIKGNEFKTHSKGIEYGAAGEPLASTGPQEYHGNIWSTDYDKSQNHFGAKHNSTDPNFVEMSRYLVNDSQNPDYNTEDYPTYFVVNENEETNFECSSLTNCEIESGLNIAWDKLDSAALTDTGSTIIYDDNVLRDLQWQVYRSMRKGIITYSSNNDNIAQTLGIEAMYQSGNDLSEILNLLSLTSFGDTILTSGSVDTLSNSQLAQIYQELSSGYDTMNIALQSYISSEGWSTGTEDTYLGYQSLALEKEADLWNTDDGYLPAFQIPMCSFEGGDAWCKLNAIQPSDSIQYLLDFSCVTFRESKPKAQKKELSIVLSPNPAQHVISISNAGKLKDEKRTFAIIDMNGKEVQSGKVTNNGKVELKPTIQSGIYFFSFNQQTVKFVVIR